MSQLTQSLSFTSEDSNDHFTVKNVQQESFEISVYSDAAAAETGRIILSRDDVEKLIDVLIFLTTDWNDEDEDNDA